MRILPKQSIFSCALSFLGLFVVPASAFADASTSSQPNIIMFVVDDLNDWVGPLGNTQAKTPNMDRLADLGVTFTNAHAPGVFCAPSRTAIWTGLQPSTTGIYTSEVYRYILPELVSMQGAFKRGGYNTYGAGKLFHHRSGYVDLKDWDEYFSRSQAMRDIGWEMNPYHLDDAPLPDPHPYSPYYTKSGRTMTSGGHLEWGPISNDEEEKMADTMRTNWACEVIKREHDKPFFLALGLYTPHHPHYAPQKYFDLYDVDSILLPPYKADDREDLPPKIKKQYDGRSKQHQELVELGALDDAIHAYYAAISYADAMLGRVLDALASSSYGPNTIVVIWSDQGFHLGEKGNWGKHTLWNRTTHVPFIWAGKGVARNQKVSTTVSLLDLYPTLAEICDLPLDHELDGTSIASIIRQPETAKPRTIFIPHMERGGYAVVNSDWRYIQYEDGTEELYNRQKDPNEWDNLASQVELEPLKAEMRQFAPEEFAPQAIPRSDLNLVVEGDSFRWEKK